MTEFHVEVVRIGAVTKHPNADTLSLTTIHDNYPVLFKSGEFKEGDLAVYVPVDSVVPDTAEWQWLAPAGAALRERDRRIKAKRLRGVFSMGLLTKAPPGAREGQDVAEQLGITKYEPDEPAPAVVRERYAAPWYVRLWRYLFGYKDPTRIVPPKLKYLPGTYDIEPFRRYGQHWFQEGELVVVTEKIHGQNASFVHDGKKLHIKSRTRWRRNDPTEHGNTWVRVAQKYKLEDKLKDYPGIVLFGETYGNNADMRYGVQPSKEGDSFVAFDAFDSETGRYFDYIKFRTLCNALEVPTAPCITTFQWGDDETALIEDLAEGYSILASLNGAKHLREGFVIKPVVERRTDRGERVILKMAGEGYLTRKAA